MKTSYEQIVDVSKIGQRGFTGMRDILSLAEKEQITVDDSQRRVLLCIDVQKDFIEGRNWTPTGSPEVDKLLEELNRGGSLPVPGSIGDVERITRFIYNNMSGISTIMCSLDTHIPGQIFHPCWWVNAAGEHPAPYTIITYEDVLQKRWIPCMGDPEITLQCLKELEEDSGGKEHLCIWDYHCIIGTEGFSLESQFARMAYFHEVACKSPTLMINKGTDCYREMYGFSKGKFSLKSLSEISVLSKLKVYDEIYVVGEAASHCVRESIKQIGEEFGNLDNKKIVVLEDCMSSIPGYEEETRAAFESYKEKYGIQFAKSTDIHF